MSNSSGRMEFEFTLGSNQSVPRRDPDAPLGILVLADVSGRGSRGALEPAASRRVQRVDIDNLESVFAGLGAALNLPFDFAPGGSLALRFAALDEFHPDQLLPRVAPLRELFAARQRLLTPATAAQGAHEVERLLGARSASPGAAAPAAAAPESADETLARLMGGAPKAASPAPAKSSGDVDVQALIQNLVGTTGITPPAPAGQGGLRSAVDLELAARLRGILHHADVQALEAAWRSVDFLVRRCPDEERIKLFLLDATPAELAADPAGWQRRLRDQPFDVIAGNFTFGASPADLQALGVIAKLGASLRAVFLAGAHPHLVGCDDYARHPDPDDWQWAMPAELREAWQAVRALPEAAHVGLALPRFLLRQPYGAGSDPIDSLDFEELPDAAAHDAFPWGNPAFLCAQVLAEGFVGGDESAGAGDVGELPVFRFQANGERAMKPCAEAWLTDRAANAIRRQGLIPCLSIKGRDAVRVAGLQSVASPVAPLALRLRGPE